MPVTTETTVPEKDIGEFRIAFRRYRQNAISAYKIFFVSTVLLTLIPAIFLFQIYPVTAYVFLGTVGFHIVSFLPIRIAIDGFESRRRKEAVQAVFAAQWPRERIEAIAGNDAAFPRLSIAAETLRGNGVEYGSYIHAKKIEGPGAVQATALLWAVEEIKAIRRKRAADAEKARKESDIAAAVAGAVSFADTVRSTS